MATTTNYGWTTPDDTSLVKDGAAAIRTLGSSVDTTTKALNPSTTLGDIEYRSSTANTNTRLPIGTSGQLLTVSGGVPAWATIATGTTFSGCSVSKSAAQTLASNTATVITFDTELFDVDGYHSNVTNNSRMTIPSGKAGYFFLYAKFRLDAGGSTGGHTLRILKNGTAISEFISMSPATIAVTGGQISQVVSGAVGDYFEIDVRQLTTGNQDMPGGATNAQFMISYLGA
jgi:hypothetical protein